MDSFPFPVLFLLIWPQLWFYLSHVDAMAPNTSRPHPYRATSDIETPGCIRPASWFAGPGCLPAGINPPPDRPILVIDYSPLQELTHPSERDHALCSVLANHRCATAGELEALFTKQPPYNSVTYAPHWQLVFVLSGTSTWYHQIWSSATLTLPEMSFKYEMTGPSCNFWMNIDLNGAFGSITTSSLLY